jgi:hypothetical protein
MDNIFLKSFHIAGFSHYQGAYVFSELTIHPQPRNSILFQNLMIGQKP